MSSNGLHISDIDTCAMCMVSMPKKDGQIINNTFLCDECIENVEQYMFNHRQNFFSFAKPQ